MALAPLAHLLARCARAIFRNQDHEQKDHRHQHNDYRTSKHLSPTQQSPIDVHRLVLIPLSSLPPSASSSLSIISSNFQIAQ